MAIAIKVNDIEKQPKPLGKHFALGSQAMHMTLTPIVALLAVFELFTVNRMLKKIGGSDGFAINQVESIQHHQWLAIALIVMTFVLAATLIWRINKNVVQFKKRSKQMAAKLNWQANHDQLTGLISRNAFEKHIEQAIETARNEGVEHALMYMDLDRFKIVNDTCGHIAGDALLAQLGYIFQQHLDENGVLARLGGDEFGMLLYRCDEHRALAVANEFIEATESFRFSWEEKFFTISVSVGLVMVNPDSTTVRELLSHADIACYSAKDKGRGCVEKYTRTSSKSYQEMSVSLQIRQAIEKNRFVLYHQRIKGIGKSDKLHDASEILLRMKTNDDSEPLSPGVFLPIAERYNMMKSIDRWVVENCLRFMKEHEKQLKNSSHRYYINLSGETINDDSFFDFLSDRLEHYKVEPNRLCFEITESIAIRNLHSAAYMIGFIKRLGCSISLDDFGTGTSSFAYLKYLSIDYLKIDGTFIKDITSDKIDYEIVTAINNICKALDIRVIAEFVETLETEKALKELGIDYAQGYAIQKPVPLAIEN